MGSAKTKLRIREAPCGDGSHRVAVPLLGGGNELGYHPTRYRRTASGVHVMLFPGMDPYLEDPQLWTGVHTSLIVYIRDFLQPLLRPRYVAAIEERVYLEGPEHE